MDVRFGPYSRLSAKEIDAFELWLWRRFLRVPWIVKDQTIGKDQSIGNQLWVFIGRTDAATEAPMVWPPDAKSQLIGRPWCWERLRAVGKGTTEDEMVGWHRWLNGHEFEQAQGDGEGQGSLVCCMQFMGSQSRIWLSNWTTTCCIKRWETPLATFILWLTPESFTMVLWVALLVFDFQVSANSSAHLRDSAIPWVLPENGFLPFHSHSLPHLNPSSHGEAKTCLRSLCLPTPSPPQLHLIP